MGEVLGIRVNFRLVRCIAGHPYILKCYLRLTMYVKAWKNPQSHNCNPYIWSPALEVQLGREALSLGSPPGMYSLSRIMAMEAEEKCWEVRMLNGCSQNSCLDNKWFWWWCANTSWSVFTLKSWRLSGHKNFSLCCADIVGSLRNLKRVTMWWWSWHSEGPFTLRGHFLFILYV